MFLNVKKIEKICDGISKEKVMEYLGQAPWIVTVFSNGCSKWVYNSAPYESWIEFDKRGMVIDFILQGETEEVENGQS